MKRIANDACFFITYLAMLGCILRILQCHFSLT